MSSLPEQLKSCGVVGAGGAGFPTYVKAQSEVEYLLVNGAECEPLLHKDYELMKNYAPGIVEGAKLMRSARSEEHTSELQSRRDLVCRLLLEKKKEQSPEHDSIRATR